MKKKQVIMMIPLDTYTAIKTKCRKERRSVPGQLCKLIDDFYDQALPEKVLSRKKALSEGCTSLLHNRRVSIKIPEDTYWKAAEEGAKIQLGAAKYCAFLIISWATE